MGWQQAGFNGRAIAAGRVMCRLPRLSAQNLHGFAALFATAVILSEAASAKLETPITKICGRADAIAGFER
jgi:hypothetical protein